MAGFDIADPVTGTYTVGPDGRGTISLDLQGMGTTETFALTITSVSHALLNQDDGTDTGSGVLDLQTAGPTFTSAQFSGGYSFTLSGEDYNAFLPTCFGGVFAADGIGNLQAGTIDENDGGTFTTTPFTATFSAPDANGRGTIALSSGASFAYYLVRPGVVRLVETDLLFVLGGTAYAQGAGSTFTNSALGGAFVFNTGGASLSGSFTAAGEFATDGNGNFISGVADANDSGSATFGALAGSGYSFNNSARGTIAIPAGPVFMSGMNLMVYLVDPNLNLLDPNGAGAGGGALILTNDGNVIGTGAIIPQTTPIDPSVSGNYAVNLTSAPSVGTEVDLTGQIAMDVSGNVSGTADYGAVGISSTGRSTNNADLTGSLAPDGSNVGRFTGTILLSGGTLQFVPGGVLQHLSYYLANASLILAIETDANPVSGYLVHQ
jgi:hypothetical protein